MNEIGRQALSFMCKEIKGQFQFHSQHLGQMGLGSGLPSTYLCLMTELELVYPQSSRLFTK